MRVQIIKFNELIDKPELYPKRQHYNDAGIDCYALEEVTLPAMKTDGELAEMIPIKIPLGFGMCLPDGYVATIKPRSSMNAKGFITQIGTIDAGYRGEIACVIMNTSSKDYTINVGDKICQIVIEPVTYVDLVDNITNNRGYGGFGSTGK